MTQSMIFQNVRLIDGLADQPQEGVSILVTGERIEAILPGSESPPPDATIIDLGGKTVTPGLIDTHVHTAVIGEDLLPLFLATGVTSIRDLGGQLEDVLQRRSDLESGKILGPRLLVYGPLLDGADWSIPHVPGFIELFCQRIPSPEAVPEKIGALLASGVDGVKIYHSMPPETTKAVIEYVDKRVPVTGHLGRTNSLDAIEAGIDGLEHVWISPYNDFCAPENPQPAVFENAEWYLSTARGWAQADLESPRARKWFDAMAENQVGFGTTLAVFFWATWAGQEAVRSDPDRRFVQTLGADAEMIGEAYATGRAFDHFESWEGGFGYFDPYASPLTEVLDKHQHFTAELHRSGGVIVGGTDGGGGFYPPTGFLLLREIEILADSLGAMDAIRAVTSVAAKYLRREEDIGAIAPGRYADLLVIDGDPLRDVREFRNLTTVYRGGVAYDAKELLAAIPQQAL